MDHSFYRGATTKDAPMTLSATLRRVVPLALIAAGIAALAAVSVLRSGPEQSTVGGEAAPVAAATADAEAPAAIPAVAPQLVDLDGLDDLRARFNDAEGKPRILLLLSPT